MGKDSRRGEEAPASHTSLLGRDGTQRKTSDARDRGRRGRTERPRAGLSAVFAEHRTEEGGEPRPTGPTGGQEKPGITFCGKERREGLRAYKPCYHNASSVQGGAQLCATRGVTCVVSPGRKPVATEEPEEGNLHVRICGEGAG